MPGRRCRRKPPTMGASPRPSGLRTKASSAWVPNSTRLSWRAWGKAQGPRGPAGRADATGAAGTAERLGVGWRVGQIERGTIDADQAQARVDGAGGLWRGEGADYAVEQAPHRADPEAATRHAKGIARWRLLAVAEAAGVLEDLTKGQAGEHAHSEHNPQHDLVGQPAVAAVASAGLVHGLADHLGGDKLVQADQPIQDLPGRVQLEHQRRLSRHSQSLPESLWPSNHKLSGGCDLRT